MIKLVQNKEVLSIFGKCRITLTIIKKRRRNSMVIMDKEQKVSIQVKNIFKASIIHFKSILQRPQLEIKLNISNRMSSLLIYLIRLRSCIILRKGNSQIKIRVIQMLNLQKVRLKKRNQIPFSSHLSFFSKGLEIKLQSLFLVNQKLLFQIVRSNHLQ